MIKLRLKENIITQRKKKYMIHGDIFVIAAPSGAGKSSLVKGACEKDNTLQLSISHTSRPMRPNELNGVDYYFVSDTQFEQMLQKHEFIEYAKVYGNYYGTNLNTIQQFMKNGKDIILEIDWQGARQIKKLFPNAILIFILPPSIEELAKRLIERKTDSYEVIKSRIELAQEDISHANEFDYVIVNDNFDTALHDLCSIIRTRRLLSEKILSKYILNEYL